MRKLVRKRAPVRRQRRQARSPADRESSRVDRPRPAKPDEHRAAHLFGESAEGGPLATNERQDREGPGRVSFGDDEGMVAADRARHRRVGFGQRADTAEPVHHMLRVDPTDSRIIDAAGRPHPRRWAIGPFTDAPFAGAFSRPNTNAISFRENDRTARAVMQRIEHAAEPAADVRTLELEGEPV